MQGMLSAWKESGLVTEDAMIEGVALDAACSSGVDIVLFQEQLGTKSDPVAFGTYSADQLKQLVVLAQPFLMVD